ncbi:MAG: hypothetical protein A2W25_03720 [candidate division Zixibacteria bacterium RBG_16_53_22]|nr:MAG: hypothetical protein A2W25_03720 [candidate division Zixibacteria bacterium RBG_16_53_22]
MDNPGLSIMYLSCQYIWPVYFAGIFWARMYQSTMAFVAELNRMTQLPVLMGGMLIRITGRDSIYGKSG